MLLVDRSGDSNMLGNARTDCDGFLGASERKQEIRGKIPKLEANEVRSSQVQKIEVARLKSREGESEVHLELERSKERGSPQY